MFCLFRLWRLFLTSVVAQTGTYLIRLSSREGAFVVSWVKVKDKSVIHSLVTVRQTRSKGGNANET